MTELTIITKEDCHRCAELKKWLKRNDIDYVEKDIDDDDFVHKLLQDENFVKSFCDSEGCIVNTPVVIKDGKYLFKELWGIEGLRKEKAKEIFGVK